MSLFKSKTGYTREGRVFWAVVICIIVVILLVRSLTIVPAGHVRVRSLFGKGSMVPLMPGLRIIHPFASRPKFSVRTQELTEKMNIPTSEGLMADIKLSINFRVEGKRAPRIFKTIGKKYREVIVLPRFRDTTYNVISKFASEDLYKENRAEISLAVFTDLKSQYAERGMILEKVMIKDVDLPKQVISAIEEKIAEKQASEKMEWTLAKAKKDKEVKTVEAEAIAVAQEIIAEKLTPEYIQWYYIKSLEGLVGSPNTTFVIIPFDQKLIPMLPLEK